MLLASLAVAFVGIAGDRGADVQQQLAPVLEHAHVALAPLPDADLDVLVHHGDAAPAIVRALHADGVVAGEVTTADGAIAVRLVAYDADGRMVFERATQVASATLSADDLAAVSASLDAALAAMPTAAPPATPPAPPDSVTPQEIEQVVQSTAEASTEPAAPHVHAELGFGVVARELSPGAGTVAAYSSSAVGAIRGSGGIDVTRELRFAVMAEQALAMTTPLADGMATTTMTRWEITASYDVTRCPVLLAPFVGVGRRGFSTESADPSRTPDADYTYMMFGATARKPLAARWVASATLAFEPVVAGDQPTALVVGDQRAWGLAAGAAIELRPIAHAFVRAALDYQRFAWWWAAAGPRGSGGASDAYPAGIVAIGGEY